jgi:hypothetical protein
MAIIQPLNPGRIGRCSAPSDLAVVYHMLRFRFTKTGADAMIRNIR